MANMRSRLRASNVLMRVDRALRLSHKRFYLPPPENPHGVPSSVMRALQLAQLPTADKDLYTQKLTQLMGVIKQNGEDYGQV